MIPFNNTFNNNATLIDEDRNSCPNWIYLNIIHRVTDGSLMSWCDTFDEFIKDLSENLYNKANKKRFYVSVEPDCCDKKQYYIGTKILDTAERVWIVEGYKDGTGYFYDCLYEYELGKEMAK